MFECQFTFHTSIHLYLLKYPFSLHHYVSAVAPEPGCAIYADDFAIFFATISAKVPSLPQI